MVKSKMIILYVGIILYSLPFACYADADKEKPYSSNIIMKCSKNGSHADIVHCEIDYLEKAEKELNDLYSKKVEEAKASDMKMKKMGSEAYVFTEKSVIESQEKFTEYMDSECNRQVSYMMGGSAGADIEVICKINLINERINLLNN